MSKRWISIHHVGVVATDHIVAVGLVEAAPIRRMIQAIPPSYIMVLTGGRKRQTALVLDSGHVVITALSISALTTLLDE